MRHLASYTIAILFALLMVSFTAPPVFAQHDQMCEMTTIASLQHCVVHAKEMGHIDNTGVANSLLQKLDAAQAAENRGQSAVAVNQLEAFIQAVEAQLGKHIDADHGTHMIHHAQMVIAALGG
ncbi:MAG: hypothetical protein R2932_44715 [Caldilineaceae bacterium]